MNVTIEQMVSRWTSSERPLFKGKLIDQDGCKCAQGDVLACAGYTDDQLRAMTQHKADAEVATLLGISKTHAVLLQQVNDSVGGAPQQVLSDPAQIIGDKATTLLAFWLHLDSIPAAARDAAGREAWAAAWEAAGAAAGVAAREAAGAAAGVAARSAARSAARAAARSAARSGSMTGSWLEAETAAGAAARVAYEIQGMDLLEQQGRKPYFLAFFGFDTWEKVCALEGAK